MSRSRQDHLETARAFLAAGLENNEQCLWITRGRADAEESRRQLGARVLDLQSRLERGQIRILDPADWYCRSGKLDADSMLTASLVAEESARANGYSGLRTLADIGFLDTRDEWREFQRYESRLSEAFAGRRIIGLCSYDLRTLLATDLLEIIGHHHSAVAPRTNEWHVFENMAAAMTPPAPVGTDGPLEPRVRRRIEQLEVALEEHANAARAKDEFLAMLGHELRNPLAPMMTALQLMRFRGMESKELDILVRQVTHLTRLVDDLLDVSRIATGKMELHRLPIELSQVAVRAIELVGPLLTQRQQILEVDVPGEGLLVNADLERMAQVLGNLLANASKYSDPRSRIRISGSREGPWVRCSVTDDGIGISPEMLPGVFEPFVQQPETVRQARGGLGLGLTIVRSLVHQHGGRVQAMSEGLGRGSKFVVELPALVNGPVADVQNGRGGRL